MDGGLPLAAALGGHLVHVVTFGGSLLVAAFVYCWARLRTRRANAPQRAVAAAPREAAGLLQIAAVGLMSAAAVHLFVMPAHFRQSLIYGAFMLVVALLQVAFAVLLLTRPSRNLMITVFAACASIIVIWAWSRVVGVPVGPDNGATEELGVLDTLASACEAVSALALGLVLRRRFNVGPAWQWSRWTGAPRATLATMAVIVPIAGVLCPHS